MLYTQLYGQQYSIDKSALKQSRRLTMKEYLHKQKSIIDAKKQASKMKIMDDRTDKLAKIYAKKKQTKNVQKRMKETQKMADRFNHGKPQVDLCTNINYKIRKLYGRFF